MEYRYGAESKKEVYKMTELEAKLPVYHDTGEPFVPLVDPCFIIDMSSDWTWQTYKVSREVFDVTRELRFAADWIVHVHKGRAIRMFFSTKEAAEKELKTK